MGFFHIIQISRHNPVAFNKNLANFAGLAGVTSFVTSIFTIVPGMGTPILPGQLLSLG